MTRSRAFRDQPVDQDAINLANGEAPHDSGAYAQDKPTKNSITLPANSDEVKATDKQRAFLSSLLNERNLSGEKINAEPNSDEYKAMLKGIHAQIHDLSKRAASKWIEKLLTLPKLEQTTHSSTRVWPNVDAGRYALETDQGIKFYRVSRPTEGRWAGFTFVDIQASDELHPIRNKDQRKSILEQIEVDPKGAMLRYGQLIGACGHCGRTLTDETSRQLGIGPICRGKLGW